MRAGKSGRSKVPMRARQPEPKAQDPARCSGRREASGPPSLRHPSAGDGLEGRPLIYSVNRTFNSPTPTSARSRAWPGPPSHSTSEPISIDRLPRTQPSGVRSEALAHAGVEIRHRERQLRAPRSRLRRRSGRRRGRAGRRGSRAHRCSCRRARAARREPGSCRRGGCRSRPSGSRENRRIRR